MVAVAHPSEVIEPPAEQRMLLYASWKEYSVMRELLDRPGVRMTFLRGALELMSPSSLHEIWKKNIARLVELYAHVRGIDLHGYGSTTFKEEMKDRGAEPDECYLIGRTLTDVPDIVLEVIHTSPLLNKLDVYAGLGVPEAWVFRDGRFRVHSLGATGEYVTVERSRFLPGLDFEMLARYASRTDTPQALREFEAELRATR